MLNTSSTLLHHHQFTCIILLLCRKSIRFPTMDRRSRDPRDRGIKITPSCVLFNYFITHFLLFCNFPGSFSPMHTSSAEKTPRNIAPAAAPTKAKTGGFACACFPRSQIILQCIRTRKIHTALNACTHIGKQCIVQYKKRCKHQRDRDQLRMPTNIYIYIYFFLIMCVECTLHK